MAVIASSQKLPEDPEQFYFMSGGFVLLRIARDGGERQFSVMTATAGEARPYTPPRPRPQRPEGPIFLGKPPENHQPDKEQPAPAPKPIQPKPYPDLRKLVEVARTVPGLAGGEERTDGWGRPYIVVRGRQSAAQVRSMGNDLARALGLETYDEMWSYEELQAIHEEFSIGENGEDAYLHDGMSISSFGDLSGR